MLSAKYIKLLRKSTHKARLCTWCTPEQRANNTYISAWHRGSTLYYAAVPFSFLVSFRGQQPTAMRRLGDEAAAIHFIKMIQWLLFVLGESTGCATYCKLLPLRWGIAMRILKICLCPCNFYFLMCSFSFVPLGRSCLCCAAVVSTNHDELSLQHK